MRAHEAAAADLIGGRAVGEKGPRQVDPNRKIGRIRSDARSEYYEAECKQTGKQSIGVKVSWLRDITLLARQGHRVPLVFLRFLAAPKEVEKDWILIPVSEFKKMRSEHGAKRESWSDFEES